MRIRNSLVVGILALFLGIAGCNGLSGNAGDTATFSSGAFGIDELHADTDEVADDASEDVEVEADVGADEEEDVVADEEDLTPIKIALTPTTLHKAAIGKSYTATIKATTTPKRATGSFEWEIPSTGLPLGIKIKDSKGRLCTTTCIGGSIKISGTPSTSQVITKAGYPIAIKVTDPKTGSEASGQFLLQIDAPQVMTQHAEVESDSSLWNALGKSVTVKINKKPYATQQKINIQKIVDQGGDAGGTLDVEATYQNLTSTNVDGLQWRLVRETSGVLKATLNDQELTGDAEMLLPCSNSSTCSFRLSQILPVFTNNEQRSSDPVDQIFLQLIDSQMKELAQWSVTLTYVFPDDPIEGMKACLYSQKVEAGDDSGAVWFDFTMTGNDGPATFRANFPMNIGDHESASISLWGPELSGDLDAEHPFINDKMDVAITGQTVEDESDFDVLWISVATKHWIIFFDDDAHGDLLNDDEENSLRDLSYGMSRNTQTNSVWLRRNLTSKSPCEL